MKSERQRQINEIRENQKRQGNDWFFDTFDKNLDNMVDHPFRTFFKMGLVAVLLNLILWGTLIAMVVVGLMLVF
jgi:hypothetical protein